VKIGILTYHRLVNRGSVLQAYALHKRLASDFPEAKVEIVDYSSLKIELLPAWRFVRNRFPLPFDPHEVGEILRMRRFRRQRLSVSAERLRSDSTARAMAWLERRGYDAVVVGSDVVWEIQPRGYSIGGITPYHLPGETSFVKASFAVSMDPVVDYPAPLLPRLREMARHVRSFDFISVRDEATREVLIEHGIEPERIQYVPDPTLLSDFSELVGQPPWRRGSRPVMAVDLPRPLAGSVHEHGSRAGFEVWDWRNYRGPGVDRGAPLGLTIEQILGLYTQIDVLVTDRFHGAILASRLGGAGVVFIEHARKWPRPNSKGRDLLRRAGVEECVRRTEGQPPSAQQLDEDTRRAMEAAGSLSAGLQRLGQVDAQPSLSAFRQVLQGATNG
jgi:hypothetical protein